MEDAAAQNELINQAQQDCQKKQDDCDPRSKHGANDGVVLQLDA